MALDMQDCIAIYTITMRARLSEEIRHAVIGKQSVAAAHSAELRSFRRGWMALPALNDTVQGWVYDITFFPRVWLCRRFVSETEQKKTNSMLRTWQH